MSVLPILTSCVQQLVGLTATVPLPPPPSLCHDDEECSDRYNTSHVDHLLSHDGDFRLATRFSPRECQALARLLGVSLDDTRKHYMFTPYQRLVLFLECLSSYESWRKLELLQKRSVHRIRDDFDHWVHEIIRVLEHHDGMFC